MGISPLTLGFAVSAVVRRRSAALSCRFLGIFLALAMLLGLAFVPASVAAEPVAPAAPAGSQGPPGAEAPPVAGTELEELRERQSATYATERPGVFESQVSSGPVHYRDDKDKWHKIDRELRPAGRRFSNQGRNDFAFSVSGDHRDRELVRFDSKRGHAVAYGLAGARPGAASPDPTAGGQQIVYRSILPHVDLRLRSLADSVEEVLVLQSAKAPAVYQFPLQLTGVTARVDEDGSVVYEDADAKPVFRTPRPWMMDSSVPEREGPGITSLDASYALATAADGGQVLELRLSQQWLQDPARVFPVKVDPTVDNVASSNNPGGDGGAVFFYSDTSYASHNTTSAYTSDPNLYSGLNSNNHRHRAVLQFGGSGALKITPGDGKHEVLDATFGVFQHYAVNCQREVYAKRVTEPWQGFEDQFAHKLGPAHDANSGGVLTAGQACPPNNAGWLRFNVTDVARRWEYEDNIPNYGLALLGSFTWNDTIRAYYSQNHWDGNVRPYLNVRWRNNVPSATDGRNPSDGAVLSTGPSRLGAIYRDADFDWGFLRFYLESRRPDGSWGLVRNWEVGPHECSGCYYTADIGQTLPRGQYRWWTQARDAGNRSDWSPMFSFTVNRPPAAPQPQSPADGVRLTPTGVELAASFNDPDGDTGRVRFTLNTAAGAHVLTQDGSEVRGSGTSRLPVGAHLLSRGTGYRWSGVAHDGLADSPAGPARGFVVNQLPSAPGLQSPADGGLTTGSPTLSGTFLDPDQTAGRVHFTVRNGAGQVAAQGVGNQVAHGAASSWQVPLGALADGAHTWSAQGNDLLETGPLSGTRSFTVDATAPTDPADVTPGPPHNSVRQSGDRTVDIGWTAGQDTGSGLAGHDVLFTRDVNAPQTPAGAVRVPAPDRAATSPVLSDGVWYAWMQAVDRAGNRSRWARGGPVLVGEATLADGLLPGSAVAQSDEQGLEQFFPLDSVDLGTGTTHVNLRTGNAVTQHELVSVPGQGLNTVVKLTHNSQRADRDSGIGRGWSLSVTDLEAGLDGALEDLSDGAVTDMDVNRDVVLGQLKDGSIVQDLAYTGAQVTGDVVEFVDGDGTTHRFVRQGPAGSRWSSPPGVDLRLREVVVNGLVDRYEFIRPDGVVYTAKRLTLGGAAAVPLPVWRVVSVRDRNGNQLDYTHANFDGAGVNKTRLTEIRHNRTPGQPVVTFAYQPFVAGADNADAGVLRSITSLPGLAVDGRSYERRTDLTITPGDHRLTGWTENAHTATVNGAAVPAVEQARRSVAFTYNGDLTLATASDGIGSTRVTRFGYTPGRPAGAASTSPTVPQLTSVTDRAGAPWAYEYRPVDAKTLTIAKRPTGGATSNTEYELSAREPIEPGQDPRIAGGNVVRSADAGASGTPIVTKHGWRANKLVSTTDGENATTSFRYDSLGLLTGTTSPAPNRPDAGAGVPTAPVDSTLTYRYGGRYSVGCDADPAAGPHPVSRAGECALFADLTRVVTAAGTDDQRVADFAPNAGTGQLEQVIERWNAEGTPDADRDRTTAFTYHANGSLASINGPRADVQDLTRYDSYDRTGQPGVITDAENKTKTFAYSPYGVVLSLTDRDGRVTTSRYDQRDNLISATVPGGAVTDYRYDANDNKTSETQPARTRDGVTYRPVTVYLYDPMDRPTVTRAPGADERPNSTTGKTVTTTAYWPDGAVRSVDGPLPGDDITTFDYWPNRLLQRRTEPAAGTKARTDYDYDRAGRTTTVTMPEPTSGTARPVERTVYTPAGDVAETTETSSSGAVDRKVSTVYNVHGEPVSTTGPRSDGGQTAREVNGYDRFGQVELTRRLAGRTATGTDRWIESATRYDLAGNTVSSTQATGDGQRLESTYRYDALSRLAEQTQDPVNPDHKVRYAYNGEGQQTARHDVRADGTALRSTETFYNDDNTKRAEAVTTFDPATPADRRTLSTCNTRADGSTGYDSDGNLLVTRTVAGPTRAAGTDGCGTAGAVVLREQTTVYDDRDWPTSVTTGQRPPTGGAMITRTQRMTYHADGSKASLTHDDGTATYTTTYGITPAGWDETVTDWRGRTTTAAYLPNGGVSAHTLGANSASPDGAARAASGYHADGSLSSLTWTAGGQTVRAHTGIGYDTGGIRTTEDVQIRQPGATTNTTGTARYSYDLLDRLTSYTSPFGHDTNETRKPTTTYTLDDGGNTVRELTAVADADGANRRTLLDQTSSYTSGRLTGRTSRQTVTELASQVSLVTTNDSFTYNSLGEETRRQSSDSYASTVPLPGTSSASVSTFDAAGHPLRSDNTATRPAGTAQGEVDAANADVDYVYDSADRVLSRTEHKGSGGTATAATTLFFYAAGSGQLLEETDAAGKTKVRYLLDGEGEPVAQQTYTTNTDGSSAAPAGEKWSWLLNDALGNTATVVDDAGAVIEQKAFDPHGKPQTGGSAKTTDTTAPTTTVGFQSARTDEATGRVMLGQRQYDPGTARFTTPDVYAAGMLDLQLGTDSLTGNRYLFAGASPMSFYEDGHGPFGRLKKIAKRAMPVLAYVPVVSTAIDVASAATGRDFYNGGRKLTGAQRLQMLGSAALKAVPGVGVAAAIGGKAASKAKAPQKVAAAVQSRIKQVRASGDRGSISIGRSGDQARLRELANDDKVARHLRGWIRQEINDKSRTNIRRPPGYQLAHRRGFEARLGFGYRFSDLQTKILHRLQHRHEGYRPRRPGGRP